MTEIELTDDERTTLVMAIDIARSSDYDHQRRALLGSIGGAAALDDLRVKLEPPALFSAEDHIMIVTTARTLLDKFVWREACDMLGINEWAINEGQMETDHKIELTAAQAKALGII